MGSKRGAVTNTAAIKENYTITASDGNMTFFRQIQLADLTYDRAQAVAAAFQEYCIKYVKLTIQPSADTFAPAAGNVIPQLYFMYDKSNTLPTNVSLQNLLDMGCKPTRFDAKNIVRAWKPCALTADMVSPGAVAASQRRTSPWLSTNANAGNPGPAWAPSAIDHGGAVLYVTQMNPLTPPIGFKVDVEVVFQFRKPLWSNRSAETVTPASIVKDGQVLPIIQA